MLGGASAFLCAVTRSKRDGEWYNPGQWLLPALPEPRDGSLRRHVRVDLPAFSTILETGRCPQSRQTYRGGPQCRLLVLLHPPQFFGANEPIDTGHIRHLYRYHRPTG